MAFVDMTVRFVVVAICCTSLTIAMLKYMMA